MTQLFELFATNAICSNQLCYKICKESSTNLPWRDISNITSSTYVIVKAEIAGYIYIYIYIAMICLDLKL